MCQITDRHPGDSCSSDLFACVRAVTPNGQLRQVDVKITFPLHSFPDLSECWFENRQTSTKQMLSVKLVVLDAIAQAALSILSFRKRTIV